MKASNILPKTNLLIILLIVGFTIASLGYFIQIGYSFIASPSDIAQLSSSVKLALGIILFLKSIFGIFIGIWLSKKASLIDENKYTWFLFGLCFSIFAVILFYLILIYKKLNVDS